mmetsp:Transcript_39994/g.68230  ORF Transcript_39994/g.68230 Transcript_39994/m.68230 type:complete len:307 (-) Transcript_39994:203-1123(-)|eukprot:CAMPEP_0183713574 /NCGR_PEP_ID=MMETSP0737-20130205/8378_1 /TAXON_ID=385413 /ORGANISM="Thalassiosira miniscula, Strain CCMP1093" /LENGTH=306 /DNA_ID=CAMNT_0025942373 /DNA_START=55 /DNA_END=975 /DNA_ORIENTATION=-
MCISQPVAIVKSSSSARGAMKSSRRRRASREVLDDKIKIKIRAMQMEERDITDNQNNRHVNPADSRKAKSTSDEQRLSDGTGRREFSPGEVKRCSRTRRASSAALDEKIKARLKEGKDTAAKRCTGSNKSANEPVSKSKPERMLHCSGKESARETLNAKLERRRRKTFSGISNQIERNELVQMKLNRRSSLSRMPSINELSEENKLPGMPLGESATCHVNSSKCTGIQSPHLSRRDLLNEKLKCKKKILKEDISNSSNGEVHMQPAGRKESLHANRMDSWSNLGDAMEMAKLVSLNEQLEQNLTIR